MKIKKEARKERNWVYNNFLSSLKYLQDSKNYILFAFLLLLISVIFGFAFPSLFEKQVLGVVQDLIKQTEGLSGLELISFIIFNNMKSAFLGLIFGIFFAIAPLIVTIVNGYVLGFVMNKSVSAEGILILWRLLPHGIFEIPAVLISIGLGLKLGILFIKLIYNILKFYSKINSKIILFFLTFLSILIFPITLIILFILFLIDRKLIKDLNNHFKLSLKVFLLIIIPLLVIAGIIEGLLIVLTG